MKNLAIYFSSPGVMDYPFHDEAYYSAYQEVIRAVETSGDVQVFIVRGDSYQGSGKFSHGWRFVEGKQELFENIEANLIFNRDDKNTIPKIYDCKIINHPELDEICVDKFKTFERFPNLSPRTVYIHSFREFLEQKEKWMGRDDEIIVLKKNFLTEGRGIYVQPIGEVRENLYEDWTNILMQEFMDSSLGIPGVIEGMHDLRVTVVNGEPINSFVRTPKQGSYLANIAQGGKGMALDLEQVPQEVMDIVNTIQAGLSQYTPSLFAADFMNTTKGYQLVELNSRPGLQYPKITKTYKKFNDAVAKMLLQAI